MQLKIIFNLKNHLDQLNEDNSLSGCGKITTDDIRNVMDYRYNVQSASRIILRKQIRKCQKLIMNNKNECKVNYCYEAVILFQEMSEFLTLIHTEI